MRMGDYVDGKNKYKLIPHNYGKGRDDTVY